MPPTSTHVPSRSTPCRGSKSLKSAGVFKFFEQNSLFNLSRPSFHKKQDQGEGTKVRSTPCASKSSLASLIRSLAQGEGTKVRPTNRWTFEETSRRSNFGTHQSKERVKKHLPRGKARRFAYFFGRCKVAARPHLEDAPDCKKPWFSYIVA